jgi:hypothetical protein
MKSKFVIAVALVLAATVAAQAEITGASCTQDNDGALIMEPATDVSFAMVGQRTGEPTLTVNETQLRDTAHIFPVFTATAGDPAAWVIKEVANQTTFEWTDYHFNMYMPNDFDITSTIQPLGWTVDVTQPVWQEHIIRDGVDVGSGWHGMADFFQGTGNPIPIGDPAEFGVRMWWASGTGDFCIEQIATPEPASLVLLALGAVMLRRR